MGKMALRQGSDKTMSSTAVVDQAASWAKRLTQSEARGPGDLENAWHRLEARYGIPWRAFWSLRYRKPNEIAASIYLSLCAAYEAECQKQVRKLTHEIAITQAIAGAANPAVVAAKTMVGTEDRDF